jgi:hypothetical protein
MPDGQITNYVVLWDEVEPLAKPIILANCN